MNRNQRFQDLLLGVLGTLVFLWWTRPYQRPIATKSASLQESKDVCQASAFLSTALSTSSAYQVRRVSKFGKRFNIAIYKEKDIISSFVDSDGGWRAQEVSEIHETLTAMDKARENGTNAFAFLDIGGNLGYQSLGVASHGHRVYTFEALPENQFLLQASLCMNPALQVRLFSVALGEKKKTCTLYSDNGNRGCGTMSCERTFRPPYGYAVRSAHVPVRTLDSFAGELKDIGVAKISVEGFEARVVQGGYKVLAQVPYVMLKFAPGWIRRNAGDPSGLLQWFQDQGFVLFADRWNGQRLTLEEALKRGSDLYLSKQK